MQSVRHALAYGVVVEDPDDRRAARFGLFDQFHHRCAVLTVERGGGFIQEQNRVIDDKAAGDVDALLLAAGKGRRGEVPQKP